MSFFGDDTLDVACGEVFRLVSSDSASGLYADHIITKGSQLGRNFYQYPNVHYFLLISLNHIEQFHVESDQTRLKSNSY